MAATVRKLNQVAPLNCNFLLLRRQICLSVNLKSNFRGNGSKMETDVRVDRDGFRILEIAKPPPPSLTAMADRTGRRRNKYARQMNIKPPRYTRMPVDQDWTNVWPSAHTFKYSAVPLPVRQGRVESSIEGPGDGLSPDKYGNLELMKIPNFLHLTPDHIRKHCMAIKKYTTAWPKNLETDEEMTEAFPLEIISSDYCFAGPSVRDDRARIVTIKFLLKALKMDAHGEDKFIKLVGDRYDESTGLVTMKMDRCPSKIQNLDYLMYQLTALYFESMTVEPWEELITEEDMRHMPWGSTNSKKFFESILSKDPNLKDTAIEKEVQNLTTKTIEELKDELVKRTEAKPVMEKMYNYRVASEHLLNGKNEKEDIENYKQAVLKLLNLPVSSETNEQEHQVLTQDSVSNDLTHDPSMSSGIATQEYLLIDNIPEDSVSMSDVATRELAAESGIQDSTSSKEMATSETTGEKDMGDVTSLQDTEKSSSDSAESSDSSDSSDSSSDEEGPKQ